MMDRKRFSAAFLPVSAGQCLTWHRSLVHSVSVKVDAHTFVSSKTEEGVGRYTHLLQRCLTVSVCWQLSDGSLHPRQHLCWHWTMKGTDRSDEGFQSGEKDGAHNGDDSCATECRGRLDLLNGHSSGRPRSSSPQHAHSDRHGCRQMPTCRPDSSDAVMYLVRTMAALYTPG